MIRLKVPELMEKKGWNITDLMRRTNIAYSTAHRLSKGQADKISMEVLNTLCKNFNVQVKDILEYVPDE